MWSPTVCLKRIGIYHLSYKKTLREEHISSVVRVSKRVSLIWVLLMIFLKFLWRVFFTKSYNQQKGTYTRTLYDYMTHRQNHLLVRLSFSFLVLHWLSGQAASRSMSKMEPSSSSCSTQVPLFPQRRRYIFWPFPAFWKKSGVTGMVHMISM